MAERLEGKIFGYLEVIEYDKDKRKWKCKCQCGNTTYIATRNLKTGNTKSCGCMKNAVGIKKPRKDKYKKMLYKNVGQLKVTKIDENKDMAICLCTECGKHYVEIPLVELAEMYKSRKKSYTCGIDGCVHTRKKSINRQSNSIEKGERFGNLIVEKRLENKIIKTDKSFSSIPMFLCKCDCGNSVEVQGRYLIVGKTTSCGCKKGKNFKTRNSYKDITSTEEGKMLYDIFKRWKSKFKQPSNSFKKNIIDCGIKFFPELEDKEKPFECFYRWAVLSGFSKENHYLERRDYLKDFSSSNCFWTNVKTKGY